MGEPDTDRLAELPVRVLMDWQEYLAGEAPKESDKFMPPEKVLGLLKQRYSK